ncbi:MAG TPA: DUF533 domain-containing protein [Planctomycetota bacterium]|nr:DUF533 domain-containing protein [Planctomycetota bacterium]
MSQPNPFSRDELLAFTRAVANVIAADHKVSAEEREHIGDLIRELGLSLNDVDVQRVIYDQLAKPCPIEETVKELKNPVLRRQLYRTLVEVAVSDGLKPEEDERLAKIAAAFELNAKAARELVHWTVKSIELEKQEEEILARL